MEVGTLLAYRGFMDGWTECVGPIASIIHCEGVAYTIMVNNH